ncbi:S1/P1 nuclease [Zhouia sp. PK063]|uniref:S1/P1 nuclease n=1 Tax=Zhouia sp. PK063 TaxID=3373602 RepID=UPI0037A02334
MKKIVLLVFLVSTYTFANAPFWGKTGHRVVGEVASQYIKNSTKRKIEKILNGASLADVATYADDIKSDKRFRKYSPWHYVDFPFGKNYGDEQPSNKGDLAQGIKKCVEVLKDKNASQEDKAFYLKMLIHFVGDLHQPLHVGLEEDMGGNKIQVQWFGHSSNLHRVWDSDMIDDYKMSYSELAVNLPTLSKEQVKTIQEGTYIDWIAESHKLAEKVEATAKTGDKLSYEYMYDNFGTVKMQLEKGGIRLAKMLDEIF